MKKISGLTILRILTWPMQWFPLGFHFLVSDLLFFLIYSIFRYRRKVVKRNLSTAFPEKGPREIAMISRKFYKRFTDLFIETLYFIHIDPRKAGNRLTVKNTELIERLLAEGRNVILLAGHFGNWEYFQLFTHKLEANRFFIYKRINNPVFDQLYRDTRSRAAEPVEMKQAYRKLFTEFQNHRKYIAFFISDQRPIPEALNHWLTFMNQDTPVMTGTEKIARKTNAAVVYTEIRKIERGYHQLLFELIVEDPSMLNKYEITDAFYKRLEKSVKEAPEQYFWTHKRWKYARKTYTAET